MFKGYEYFLFYVHTHEGETAGLGGDVEEVGVVADHQVLQAAEEGDGVWDVHQALVRQVEVSQVHQLQDLHGEATVSVLVWTKNHLIGTGSKKTTTVWYRYWYFEGYTQIIVILL